MTGAATRAGLRVVSVVGNWSNQLQGLDGALPAVALMIF